MAEQYGIENLKKVLTFGFAVGNGIGAAAKDGFGWEDLPLIIPIIMAAPDGYKALPHLPNEIGDISPEEKLELETWGKAQFDIPQDDIEEWIEDTYVIGIDVLAYLKKYIIK